MGAVFALTRFSLVRISIRDLVADGKSLARNSGVGGGGENSILTSILSGLPNANAESQRFSYAISQIAPLPPVVALNRSFKSQIAARYAAFWHAISQIALTSLFSAPKSQRLQHANATKSQTPTVFKSQRFSATKHIKHKERAKTKSS